MTPILSGTYTAVLSTILFLYLQCHPAVATCSVLWTQHADSPKSFLPECWGCATYINESEN